MKRNSVLLCVMLVLGACGAPNTAPNAEQVARDAVKTVVNPIISSQFPGVPTDIVVDCIIDNSSATEIVEIANSALLGSPSDSLYVILPIAQRPETIQCIAAKSLGMG